MLHVALWTCYPYGSCWEPVSQPRALSAWPSPSQLSHLRTCGYFLSEEMSRGDGATCPRLHGSKRPRQGSPPDLTEPKACILSMMYRAVNILHTCSRWDLLQVSASLPIAGVWSGLPQGLSQNPLERGRDRQSGPLLTEGNWGDSESFICRRILPRIVWSRLKSFIRPLPYESLGVLCHLVKLTGLKQILKNPPGLLEHTHPALSAVCVLSLRDGRWSLQIRS